MLPSFDAPFSQEILDEALSYELSDSISDDFPDGLDAEKLGRLYFLSSEGDARGIPELKKLIARYPDFPPLKNYLTNAYRMRGMARQARETEKEMFRLHPDYLFARLGEASRHMRAEDWEQMRATLGGTLRMCDIHPEGEEIHESHWMGYYTIVAAYYAETGNLEAAQGILNAFDRLGFRGIERDQVQHRLAVARLAAFQRRLAENDRKAIRVEVPPLPTPAREQVASELQFPQIGEIFEYDEDFPQGLVDEILALDREKAVADLETVIRDEIANASLYLKRGDDTGWAVIHALMLLSEMKAAEALETVLSLLSQHPEILGEWFGDFISWQPFAGVVGEDLPRLAEWMKTPGISFKGRSYAAEAVAHRCLAEPARRERTVAWFRELLEFFRDARREDNVLDTQLVTDLVGDITDLRAKELAPLIRELYAKNLVSEITIGDLQSVLDDLESPPDKRAKDGALPMTEFYEKLMRPAGKSGPEYLGAGLDEILGGGAKPRAAPRIEKTVGRNDPCPCGSGKKHKKCCMT